MFRTMILKRFNAVFLTLFKVGAFCGIFLFVCITESFVS